MLVNFNIRRTPLNVCESKSVQASSFDSFKYLKGFLFSLSGIQTNSNLLRFYRANLSERRFLTAERTYEVKSCFSFVATYVSQSVSRCFGQIIRTMNNSICDICGSQQQNSSSKPSEVEDPLYSTIIANIVFNVCLCYPTIMLNILTIHALRKTSALSKPLKTFLLSLAVSDLGVGLLGQPLNIAARLVPLLRSSLSIHTIGYTLATVLNIVCLSSFFSIMALSTERFIAIQKPLRYQDIVTQKRVVVVAIMIWLFSAFLGMSFAFLERYLVPVKIIIVIETLLFIATTWSSYKIYLTARHQKIQMQSQVQQVSQNSDTVNISGIRKSAHTTLLIYLAFWVCYLPRYFYVIVYQLIQANKSIASKTLDMFSLTLVLLNSSVNPIIYCWRMRHVRHTMMKILRSIFRKK